MDSKRKLTPVQQAAERANVGAKLLRDRGFSRLECTQDKCGIDWSRWVKQLEGEFGLPAGFIHVVLWATPHGFDIFEAVTYENSIPALEKGLDRAIREH